MGWPDSSSREYPEWMTDTGRHRLDALEDLMHERALGIISARVPKWTAGALIAAAVGLVGIIAAIGSMAVAADRTKEIPDLRATVARHETSIEVNRAEHRSMLESLERMERRLGTKGDGR